MPKVRTDFLEQTLSLRVPPEKFDAQGLMFESQSLEVARDPDEIVSPE